MARRNSKLMDAVQALEMRRYVANGRKCALHTDAELLAQWPPAFRTMVRFRTRENMEREADLSAELFVRRIPLPWGKVKAEAQVLQDEVRNQKPNKVVDAQVFAELADAMRRRRRPD